MRILMFLSIFFLTLGSCSNPPEDIETRGWFQENYDEYPVPHLDEVDNFLVDLSPYGKSTSTLAIFVGTESEIGGATVCVTSRSDPDGCFSPEGSMRVELNSADDQFAVYLFRSLDDVGTVNPMQEAALDGLWTVMRPQST